MEIDKGFDRLWEKLYPFKHVLFNKKFCTPPNMCSNYLAIRIYFRQNLLTDGEISKNIKWFHNSSYSYFAYSYLKDVSWFSIWIYRYVHISMNGTLLLPLFIKLQSIRWLCTYVHLPSGLHVNKQISCGSNYTLKETFSSISTLEAHNTSSRVPFVFYFV